MGLSVKGPAWLCLWEITRVFGRTTWYRLLRGVVPRGASRAARRLRACAVRSCAVRGRALQGCAARACAARGGAFRCARCRAARACCAARGAAPSAWPRLPVGASTCRQDPNTRERGVTNHLAGGPPAKLFVCTFVAVSAGFIDNKNAQKCAIAHLTLRSGARYGEKVGMRS